MWPVSGIMSNPGSGEQDVWVEGVRLKGHSETKQYRAHMEMVESQN